MSITGKNSVGNLYGLTTLCPIKIGSLEDVSHESLTRALLAELEINEHSPFARVPNTYFARFYILKDVFYGGTSGKEEHLKSQYLVFTSNFYGELQSYLQSLWNHSGDMVQEVWKHCVGFDKVLDDKSFAKYLRRCQVNNALLFNGSTDQPLAEQLKGLYLKQRFGEFVTEHQHLDAEALKIAFTQFLDEVQVDNVNSPSWVPGASTLATVGIA